VKPPAGTTEFYRNLETHGMTVELTEGGGYILIPPPIPDIQVQLPLPESPGLEWQYVCQRCELVTNQTGLVRPCFCGGMHFNAILLTPWSEWYEGETT
jgi:hypothetical protein